MKTIHAALVAVNAILISPSSAVGGDTGLRESCYILMGIAFVERGIFQELKADENGFLVKKDEGKWAALDKETKKALKDCLDVFVDAQRDEEELDRGEEL